MKRCGICGSHAPPATAALTGQTLCKEHYRAAEARLERTELVPSEACAIAKIKQEMRVILGPAFVPDLAVA
jgi:hypothetical protein